jgi:putative membrane protein
VSENKRDSLTHWLGVLGFVTLFALVLSLGRSMTAQSASGRSAELSKDNQFVATAAAGSLAEVKFGKLALEKASDPTVKAFARRMADDHAKTGEQLKEVARSLNITLPSELNSADRAQYDQLSKLSGPEFDYAYMQMMLEDHEKDVAEFKQEAASGKNPAIKNFAAQTLPTLEDHLRQARDVAANRKASL